MKANPGGSLAVDAILGREREIDRIWRRIESQSVLFTAERRIGKTCMLEKMKANPRDGWTVLMRVVESARHPIDAVEALYDAAEEAGLRSDRDKLKRRFGTAYKAISGAEAGGFRIPEARTNWKRLLNALFEDLTETGGGVLVAIDEFPHFVGNMMADDPTMAMAFLDFMRETRQRLERSGGIRFLLTGSIGLHLVVEQLKSKHGYRGNPTNDMAIESISGMSADDTALMCRRYLDDEDIERPDTAAFDRRMWEATDGLPLYVQYVCDGFQASGKKTVEPNDIDDALDAMLDSQNMEWFKEAADRLRTHYRPLGADLLAGAILDLLCREPVFVPEADIHDFVSHQMEVDQAYVLATLDLLRKDHYIDRDTSGGGRRYRFLYELMRRWWHLNRRAA